MALDRQHEQLTTEWFRTTLKVAGVVLLFLAATWFVNVWWQVHTFLRRTVASDTGISVYTTLKDVHNQHHWAAILAVDPSETQKLLIRYPFQSGYSEQIYAGIKVPPEDHECTGCLFFLQNTSHYGYRLYRLTPDLRRVMIDDEFGT